MKPILTILAAATLFTVGCSSQGANTAQNDTATTSSGSAAETTAAPAAPAAPQLKVHDETGTPARSATAAPEATDPKPGDEVAVITTNLGRIVLKFFPDVAPNHVANFEKLAKKGFYDGTKFHRVIPEFMIQGGDPKTKGADRSAYGTGGPGYTIKNEFNGTPHKRGTLSMARTNDPDSAGSQFFICVAPTPQLDNQYTVFGEVVEGMDVVDKIVNLPRDENDDPTPGHEAVMKSVKIVKWPVK